MGQQGATGTFSAGFRIWLVAALLAVVVWPTPGWADHGFDDGQLVLESPSLYELLYYPGRAGSFRRPTVALALSGGGARCLAQIGVLRALEEKRISVSGIAGTSMGAILGGLFAAGYTAAQLDSLAKSVEWTSFLSNAPPRTYLLLPQKDIRARSFLTLHFHSFKPVLPASVTGGQRLVRMLTELCHAPDYHCRSDFDSLPIPFRSVTTDLISGRKIVLSRGDLVMSLRATSAFPLAQSPVNVDSMMLVDGGLTDPVPVDVARSFGADFVLAVNTGSELEKQDALDNIYTVANQATTIMTGPQMEQSLLSADAIIQPDLSGYTNLDFEFADSIIARGYESARRVLDSLFFAGWAGVENPAENEKILLDSVVICGLPAQRPELTAAAAFLTESNATAHSAKHLEQKLQQVIGEGYVRRLTARIHRDSNTTFAEVIFEPNPLFTTVDFAGNSVFPNEVLQTYFAALPGKPANDKEIAAAARRLLNDYQERAYSLAEIRRIELDSATGRVSIVVDEGRVSGLQITGNRTVKDWVITRHFPLRLGQPFNYRVLLKGMEDLHASGLFDQINAKIKRSDGGPLVILEVQEKNYDIVRLGLRHDLEYQTDGFVEIVNTNMMGLGNEIYFHIGYCPRRECYAAGLRADRVFRTYLTARISAYREIHERHRYFKNRRQGFFEAARDGLRISLGQNLKRFGTVSGEFRTEDIKLTEQPPLPFTTARLRSVILSARFDDLDRLPFPRIGRRVDASIEWANDFVGGNVIFRKISLAVGNWFSPSERLTIGQRVTIGSADRTLPDYEKFSLGGRKTMMGLHDDEFINDKLALANLNFRYRFFTRSFFNLRLDFGAIWGYNPGLNLPDDLRIGAGAGPSFNTPLGPLELFWGIAEEGYTNFYFNWGYDF